MNQSLQVFYLPRPSRLIQYFQSRLSSPSIKIEEVHKVLEQYGLETVRPPRNLPFGRRSRNVFISTTAGKKVLKRYRRKWHPDTITYGHSIHTYLAEHNFPTPRLVTTPQGATFINLNGENYALFDFVKGVNYSSSYLPRAQWLKLVALAGKNLAHFHRQLAGFVPKGRHHLGFQSYTGDRQQNLAWYVDRLKELNEKSRYLNGHEGKAQAEYLIQNTDWILEELHRLDEVLKAANLKRLVIHGDYGIQNLLFQRDGNVMTMDLELARLEWQLSDFVTSLARFRYSNGTYDIESMRCFVIAYQVEHPLTAKEWRYLPEVWWYRRIQRSILHWISYFKDDNLPARLVSACKTIHQANWALNHHDDLLALNPVCS